MRRVPWDTLSEQFQPTDWVIAPTRHAALALERAYLAGRRGGGYAPLFMSQDAVWERMWMDASWCGAVQGVQADDVQIHLLWRDLGVERPVWQAWQRSRALLVSGGLTPEQAEGAVAPDVLQAWRDFEALCAAQGCWDPVHVRVQLGATQAAWRLPGCVHVVNWTAPTPWERARWEAMQACGSDVRQWYTLGQPGNKQFVCFDEPNHEMQAALLDLAEQVQHNRHAVLVVHDLGAEHVKLRRMWQDVASSCDVPSDSVQVIGGVPLSDTPVVRQALCGLRLWSGLGVGRDAATWWHAPFWEPAPLSRSACDRIGAACRAWGHMPLSARTVCGWGFDAAWEPVLRKVWGEPLGAGTLAQWAAGALRHLGSLGWPGSHVMDTTRSAADHVTRRLQALGSARQTERCTPDVWCGVCEAVCGVLHHDHRGNAQGWVLDRASARGMPMESGWIMGLDDTRFPRAPAPDPYVSQSVQAACEPAMADPAQAAAVQVQAWEEHAHRVVCSMARHHGDVERGASSVWSAWPQAVGPAPCAPAPARIRLEGVQDTQGVALSERMPGGTYHLRAYARCPFQAYARYRLQADPLQHPVWHIRAWEMGQWIHAVLAGSWDQLCNHATLCAWADQDLEALVDDQVARVHGAAWKLPVLRGASRALLRARVLDMLKLERLRSPFEVLWHERTGWSTCQDVIVQVRVDRMDRLPDGRELLVDYKRQPVRGSWTSPRMLEPQLPLYSTVYEHVAGWACVGWDPPAWDVVVWDEQTLPDAASWGTRHVLDPCVKQDWQHRLQGMVEGIRDADAQVDPAHGGVCRGCDYGGLCRVSDGEHTS